MNFTPSDNDVVNEYLQNLGEEIAPLFIDIRACVHGTHYEARTGRVHIVFGAPLPAQLGYAVFEWEFKNMH